VAAAAAVLLLTAWDCTSYDCLGFWFMLHFVYRMLCVSHGNGSVQRESYFILFKSHCLNLYEFEDLELTDP